MNGLVSIIIPAHNAGPWIRRTIESALAQTWSHREIIVVDDGSSDDSPTIARSYASSGVRLLTQTNAGASAARNRALSEARGDYLQFLDADDLLSPGKIAAQVSLLARSAPGVLATCAWGRFVDDACSARFVDDVVFRDFSPVDFLVLTGETGAMMHPSAWLVPRTVAARAGPWHGELTLNDDGEYFARVVLASNGIVFSADPAAKSYYRSRLVGSLSQRRDDTARRSQYRSLALITQALLAAEDSPRTRRACAGYWRRFVHDFYPTPTELVAAAEAEVRRLGAELGVPPMGPKTRLLAHLVGWRAVSRLKQLIAR